MSLAFEGSAHVDHAVAVLRAGVVARDLCRRGGRAEVAAVFDRCLYLRMSEEFICIGEAAIGNGPTTLIVAAGVAQLGVRQGQCAFVTAQSIMINGVLFDLADCETWRASRWPALPSPATLVAACADIAARAAAESPAESLARAAFGTDATPFARLARPRLAKFEAWMISSLSTGSRGDAAAETLAPSLPPFAKRMAGRVASEASRVGGLSFLFAPSNAFQEPPTPDPSPPRFAWGEGNPEACASGLVGLGPGLTPAGDDFLAGAVAALDALGRGNIRAALARAVLAASGRTSPLSASLLRTAGAGHVGENFHTMVAAVIGGDAEAAITTAKRIGHTSGWDALAGTVVTVSIVATQS